MVITPSKQSNTNLSQEPPNYNHLEYDTYLSYNNVLYYISFATPYI